MENLQEEPFKELQEIDLVDRGELYDLGEGKWPGKVIGIIIIMSFKCNAGVLKLIKE